MWRVVQNLRGVVLMWYDLMTVPQEDSWAILKQNWNKGFLLGQSFGWMQAKKETFEAFIKAQWASLDELGLDYYYVAVLSSVQEIVKTVGKPRLEPTQFHSFNPDRLKLYRRCGEQGHI